MAQDPTSWQDVALALAGAPIGAAITVAGVMLTNRSNRASQERQLQAQLDLQRQSLEHDLKGEHQRRVLAKRAELYAGLLEVCEAVDSFLSWIEDSGVNPAIPDPDHEDFFDRVLRPLRSIRGQVAVYCSGEVRHQLRRLDESLEEFSQDWTNGDIARAADQTRQCVIEAAIVDRTSGLAPEGLGGA